MKMKMPKFNNAVWISRISRVLIFTLILSTFLISGLLGPRSADAAISTLQAWSNIYNNAARPAAAITYAVPAGTMGNTRMLVVAVHSAMSAAAATQTCSVSYGGQAMTAGASNFTTSSRGHTAIFYLQDTTTPGLQSASSNQLTVTLSAVGTQTLTQVDAAVFEGVDQSASPITNNQSWLNDGTVNTTIGPFATALTIGTGDLAAEIVAVNRYTSATARTLSTPYPANWSLALGPTNLVNGTISTNLYMMQNTTAGTTTSQYTASNSTWAVMSAMSIKMLPMNLQIGNGTTEASDANAGRDTTNNALDAFTMAPSAGGVTVNTLTVTGNANFTTANIVGVNIFEDNGTIGTVDSADVLLPSSYSAITGNATTVTFTTPLSVNASKNYLLAVDIAATASTGVTVTGRITAATGTIGTPSYGDTGSATLTLQTAPGLTVANGTNPADGNAETTSTNNPLDGFTLQTVNALGGTAVIDNLRVVGSANFTSTNIAGAHVYEDNVPVGTLDGADVLMQSTSSVVSGNTTTLTFSSPIYVTNTAKNYLVVVDITAGATKGLTFTGTVTAASGHGLATPTYSDSSSATLTIKAQSKITSCSTCHNYPPSDGTRGSSGAVAGSHQPHDKSAYNCVICHVAPATETSADYGHRDGTITMQSSIQGGTYTGGTHSQTNSPSLTSCSSIGCHGGASGNSPTPVWGSGTKPQCIDCHAGIVSALTASVLSSGTVTSRDAVVGEFNMAWGHKPSGKTPARAAVADADCIVCHLEGVYGGNTSAKHADGYIDLRDPDNTNGSGEVQIRDISGTSEFRFIQFATSYAAGARTSNGHQSNDIDNVLTQKFCLACHDNNGATNTSARSNNGGTGTASMPFGGYNLGANYTTANNAVIAGGLIDVKTQLSTTNSSFHPVLGPRNAGYPTTARLNAPYNGFTRTAGTRANSVVINCFDCHNTPGTPMTNRTVVAHGNAATVRGIVTASGSAPTISTGSTLCWVCHAGYQTGTTQHGAGSAMASNGSGVMSTFMSYGCNICHASGYDTAVVRPVRAQDVHGYPSSVTGPTTYKKAFIRGNTAEAYVTQHAPASIVSPAYNGGGSGTCTGMGGTICAGTRTQTYTPGGVY